MVRAILYGWPGLIENVVSFFPSDSIFSNERIETGENWTIPLNGDKRSQCISAVQQRLDLLTFDRNF